MTKSEARKVAKLTAFAHASAGYAPDVAYLARGFSTLVRSSLRSRNEIITIAAGWPMIVQHPEFII